MESLPFDAQQKWGHLYGLKKRTRSEWSASCPSCGDVGHVGRDLPDRFRIFTDGKIRGWCRSCNHFEFADADKRRLSREEQQEINRERVRLANQERQRIQEKIAHLEREAQWRGYHAAMEEIHRQMWREAGIGDNLQDYWELGYNPSLTYYWNGELKESPALTIPYWRTSHVINVQSRLLNPPTPTDKYRFTQGLPAPLFLPDKEELPRNITLLVEGAKKAMVSWLFLGPHYSVVGLPSKCLPHHQVEEIKDCDPIIIALDPDANEDGSAQRNAEIIGKDRCRIASLPAKIDDLFTLYEARPEDVLKFLETARKPS